MKNAALCLGLLFVAQCACADSIPTVWENNFEQGELTDISSQFSSGRVSMQEKEGINNSRALLLKKTDKPNVYVTVKLKKIPVEANTCYTLSFKGKVRGSDTLKNNSQLMIFFYDYARAGKGKPLPGWSVTLYDKQGKKLPNPRSAFFRAIIHDDYFRYTDTFYTHRNAAFAEITYSNNGNHFNDILIDNVQLKKREASKVLNINSDFSAGIYDYSGWQNVKKAKIEAQENGKAMMHIEPKGGIYADPVPVEQGKRYKITYKIAPSPKRVHCGLAFMDANYHQTRTSKQYARVAPGKVGTPEITFTPATGEFYMFPFVREGIVESVTVEKIQE